MSCLLSLIVSLIFEGDSAKARDLAVAYRNKKLISHHEFSHMEGKTFYQLAIEWIDKIL